MKQKLAIASLSFELNQTTQKTGRIQLMPHGEFRSAHDPRPEEVDAWILDERNGFEIAEAVNRLHNDIVIDYEHQTLNKEKNGQPAPAAGWIKTVEYIPSKGLFAEVEWTDKAATMIANGEYRYISPVFSYNQNGIGSIKGAVNKLFHAALVNFPALDGMDEVLASASAQFLPQQHKEKSMNLIELLRKVIKKPDATEQELESVLTASLESESAISALEKENQEKDKLIASLSAQVKSPNPAEFVSVDVMKGMQAQIAALSAKINADKSQQLINSGLESGKLLPAQIEWAQGLSKTEAGLASLSAYLDTVTPVPALSGSQTQNIDPGQKIVALSAEQKEAARMLGMSESEFLSIGGKQ